MIQSGSSLVAVEPNHGEIARIDPRTGGVQRLVDVSAVFGHIVPTVIAERSGDFYFSALGLFPVVPGAENIYRMSRDGSAPSVVASGFTTVLGLDFDQSGDMYVLESTTAPGFPTPFTGRVLRVDRQTSDRSVIVDGLFFPTGLKVGPDGALYISNIGFGPPIPGQILRVTGGGVD
jgi:sugar lactone lactonase YvrE